MFSFGNSLQMLWRMTSQLRGLPIGGMSHGFTAQIFEIHVFTQNFFIIHIHVNLICIRNLELNEDAAKFPF